MVNHPPGCRRAGTGLSPTPGVPNTQALGGHQIPRWDFGRPPRPVPLQEAVDDILAALRHDPQTAIPEICSLKPQAQALITQGLSLRCRALLSQLPDAGAPLSDGDIRGLLAAAEALIRIDAQQPSWRLLLTDVLTAAGTRGPGPRERVCVPGPSHPAQSLMQNGRKRPWIQRLPRPLLPPRAPAPGTGAAVLLARSPMWLRLQGGQGKG